MNLSLGINTSREDTMHLIHLISTDIHSMPDAFKAGYVFKDKVSCTKIARLATTTLVPIQSSLS